MDVAPGTMVTPNVRLVERIGEGAMGSVWRAQHLGLNTDVAVKLIHKQLASEEPEVLHRFQREASAAAQIKSAHVVQTYDTGELPDGTPFIVMELLVGESLAQRLERTGRLSMRQTAMVVSQVAKALAAAHKLGIVHRDIKPENVFLISVEDGKLVKVLDYGIAKQTRVPEAKKLTMEGMIVGTPEYLCRDQMIKSADADEYSDMWSLAVVTYEALTGELPFPGRTIPVICANVIRGAFKPITSVRPDLPPAIDEWFQHALHLDRTQRFATARDMALAFVRLLPTRTQDIEDQLMSSAASFTLRPDGAPTQVGVPLPAPPPSSPSSPSIEPVARSEHGTPRATLLESASDVPAAPRGRGALVALVIASAMTATLAAIITMVVFMNRDRDADRRVEPSAAAAAATQPVVAPVAASASTVAEAPAAPVPSVKVAKPVRGGAQRALPATASAKAAPTTVVKTPTRPPKAPPKDDLGF